MRHVREPFVARQLGDRQHSLHVSRTSSIDVPRQLSTAEHYSPQPWPPRTDVTVSVGLTPVRNPARPSLMKKFGPPKSSPGLMTDRWIRAGAARPPSIRPRCLLRSSGRPARSAAPNAGPVDVREEVAATRGDAALVAELQRAGRPRYTWRNSVPGQAPTDSGSTQPVSTVGGADDRRHVGDRRRRDRRRTRRRRGRWHAAPARRRAPRVVDGRRRRRGGRGRRRCRRRGCRRDGDGRRGRRAESTTRCSSRDDDEVEPESVVAGSSSLPQPTIVTARMTRGTRRVDFTVGSLARARGDYLIKVSASWPLSTSCNAPSTTSTTVTEQLSRLRTTRRSSPIAAPIAALMATKWLKTTESVSSAAQRGDDRSRKAT